MIGQRYMERAITPDHHIKIREFTDMDNGCLRRRVIGFAPSP